MAVPRRWHCPVVSRRGTADQPAGRDRWCIGHLRSCGGGDAVRAGGEGHALYYQHPIPGARVVPHPAWENYMRTHDLPSSFILAVTAGHVQALEDKRDGGQLLPGRVLKAWDRRAVLIRVPTDQVQRLYEPAGDRQVVLLWLPIDKDDPVPQAAAEGVRGVLHKFIVARDAPSQRLIDALPGAPKGQFVYRDAIAGATAPPPQPSAATAAPSQPHAAQRLQELETLRATGVISDAEYTAKREQIISEI